MECECSKVIPLTLENILNELKMKINKLTGETERRLNEKKISYFMHYVCMHIK